MTQYIDKDALVAKIEKRKNEAYGHEWGWAVQCATYGEIISILNTLEAKEVDFETAFVATIDHFDEKNNYGQWTEFDLRQFAEYFFELGLKTQKGE